MLFKQTKTMGFFGLVLLLLIACELPLIKNPGINNPPPSPIAPVLTAGDSQVSVQWYPVSQAEHYQVWYGTSNNPEDATSLPFVLQNTSTTISGLENDVPIYVWIRSVNANGVSKLSPSAHTTPVRAVLYAPGAPSAPQLTAGDAVVQVSWSPISGATAYEVWYGSGSDSSAATKWGNDVTATQTILSGLVNGTPVYVWLKAKNTVGASGFSHASSATPVAETEAPAAPSAPVLTVGDASLHVSWSSVSGANTYEVWYGTSSASASAVKWGADTVHTETTITGLTNGNTVYVWIKAKNSAGTSDFSSGSNAVPVAASLPPAVPAAPVLSAGDTSIQVNWTPVVGATAYEIWYGTTTNSGTSSQWGADTTATETTITGLVNGTTVYVWIKAKNTIGTSDFCPVSQAVPVAVLLAPGAPSAPDLTSGDTLLQVSWTSVSGASAYEVWYSTTNNSGTSSKWGADTTATETTITGLVNGTTVYVWIKAKNSSGTSDFGPVSSASPVAPAPLPSLSAPTGLAVTNGNTFLSVSWNAVSGATAYEIWINTSSNSATATKRGGDRTDTSAQLTALANGTPYWIWVKAKNNSETSLFSTSATGTPFAPDPQSIELMQAETMTASGSYAGPMTSPFDGMTLYANNDAIERNFNFPTVPGTYRLDVRGASNNANTARATLYVAGAKIGDFLFTGTTVSTQSLSFEVTTGAPGNRLIKLNCEGDNGTWDTYIDWVELIFVGEPVTPPDPFIVPPEPVWASRQYRNLFAEIGKTEAEIEAKVNQAFTQLFYGSSTEKIYYEMSGDPTKAYILDVHNNDVRSEGVSYGMFMCVQLNKKEEFDKLWNFAKTYMQHQSGPRTGYFAWQMNTNGTIKDHNSAPDGEEYFAMALYFAWKRWGNGTGMYNYQAEADYILNHMVNHRALVELQSWDGASENMIALNNANGRKTAKQVVFVPYGASADHTDPSYHLPHFYELWSLWAAQDNALWGEIAAESRILFRNATHPVTGLAPDYCEFDGTPTGGQHADFRYDAWRVAMNIAMDSVWWNKDSWQRDTWVDRYLNFFKGQGVSSHGSLFTIAGAPLNTDHSPGLVAMNATAALISDDPEAWKFVEELWNISTTTGQYRYYDGCLYLFGILIASGNYQIWD